MSGVATGIAPVEPMRLKLEIDFWWMQVKGGSGGIDMRAFLIVAAMMATPAVAADQFDLICTAKKEVQRYRVDLTRMEWCFGTCERVMKIHEATSGMITLSKTEPGTGSRAQGYNTINRLTGEWEWYFSDLGTSYRVQDVRGTCQPADFSGIPAARF